MIFLIKGMQWFFFIFQVIRLKTKNIIAAVTFLPKSCDNQNTTEAFAAILVLSAIWGILYNLKFPSKQFQMHWLVSTENYLFFRKVCTGMGVS